MFLRHHRLLDEFDVESNFLGKNPKVVLIDNMEALNIDNSIDFLLAVTLLKINLGKV